MCFREFSLALSDDLEGWDGAGGEAKEGENVCIIMADLHCCMVETNTTSQQLKNFKFKNRKKKCMLFVDS